jgi:hypothetical protein
MTLICPFLDDTVSQGEFWGTWCFQLQESRSLWRWLENVGTHPGTQYCIPEDLNPRKECCQKLKSCNHKVHAHPHISACKLTVYQQLTTFDHSTPFEQNFAWLTIILMCQSFVFDGTVCGFHIAIVALRIYE